MGHVRGPRYGTNTANNGEIGLQEAIPNKSLMPLDDIYIDGYTSTVQYCVF